MAAATEPVDLRAIKLVLTAGCNLRCSYCYQSDKKNISMAWDVVRTTVDRLLASRRRDVDVLFIGGEPLLEFATIERTVAYIAERKRPDMAVRYAIITNGLLLGDREAAFLAEHRFDVELSFDGVPAAQALRGAHTFAKLDGVLDRLRTSQPGFYDRHLRINITATPGTLAWLADSVKYFLFDKEVQDLSIGPLMTATPDWRPERIDELDAAFAEVFRLSLRRYRETGDVPFQTFRKSGKRRPPRRREMAMCGVGRGDQVAVDVDGAARGCLMQIDSYQVFPTTFLRSRVDALRMGDIRDAAFDSRLQAYPEAVRAAEIFSHKELKYSSYGRCGECRYFAQCSICPMSIGRVAGETDPRRVPDFGCAYNLVALKYRDRFPRLKSLPEILAGGALPAVWRLLASQPAPRRRPGSS